MVTMVSLVQVVLTGRHGCRSWLMFLSKVRLDRAGRLMRVNEDLSDQGRPLALPPDVYQPVYPPHA
ncbi:protein of unknown function (plasmid) [Cupriavidus neocaledonicus]|uniref:Uncharacterized protein n=1 Tax=Cupriavidus neocaledonicus TaxID=1040979 RepID=A0A375HT23_9BURK|nr:hypothetical protein CBM2605_U10018 [Cupriavidus neocaledonicus]SPD59900.1 protein of unknown function [Cupriavidus neocaledonicus]